MRDAARLFAIRSALLLAALLSASPGSAPAQTLSPGQASGNFSIDGKKVSLHHAYAMIQPDVFDEKKTNTAILLTEKPLDDAALADLKDLEDAGRGQTNWLFFKLDDGGSPIKEMVRHDALGDISLLITGMTHSDFQLVARTKDTIEGSIATKKEEKFSDHKFRTNVRFHAVLRTAKREEPPPDPKTGGTKLPPGGGEPGKAYFAYQQAVQKKDVAAIRKLKSADMPDMSDKDIREALELMAAMSPSKITISEGYVKGDDAVLYVTGLEDGQKRYGTVRMSRVGGEWQPSNEKWSDKPPAK